MGAYKGPASSIKDAEVRTETFKKGGKAVMSEAAKGKKPARASGGGVFSSAKAGTPRGKASHY